jgi:hypothetical protein
MELRLYLAGASGEFISQKNSKGAHPRSKNMPNMNLDEALAVCMMYNSLTYPTKAQQRALKAAEELIKEQAEKAVERFKLQPIPSKT